MRVLGFNPYHGGSHEHFLRSWSGASRHEWEICTMPPRHFKWRMRQAPVGFRDQAEKLVDSGRCFDAIFCTSLMDVATFRGLLPAPLRILPLVVFFHENQFAYPKQKDDPRDVQFGMINWTTALCADEVWFNSGFNRDSFLRGAKSLLRRMPDERSLDSLKQIEKKSRVMHLGVDAIGQRAQGPGPLRIAWVGRWEHDKRPDLFFEALRALKKSAVDFRLTCLGQSFRNQPNEFGEAQTEFADQIDHFGFVESPEEYRALLARCDVAVSTADHEFFGIALLEAIMLGCLALVPDRLVYPEIYPIQARYSGSPESLAHALTQLQHQKSKGKHLTQLYEDWGLQQLCGRLCWERRLPVFDDALESLVRGQAK